MSTTKELKVKISANATEFTSEVNKMSKTNKQFRNRWSSTNWIQICI